MKRFKFTTHLGIAGATLAIAVLFARNVRAHYFLGDDAFISFRYALHLLNGQGLTWNPGEYVEGYTNFLWVLMMSAAMRAGITPEAASTGVGIASGALILALLPIFSARMSGTMSLWIMLPSLLLASNRSFASWCTGGLETVFFSLLVFLGIWAAVEERRASALYPAASAALVVLAALTRPEGLLFAVLIGAWLFLDVVRGARPVRSIVLWSALVASAVGAHLFWRHWYYGAWLPNTFAAKVPAPWWNRGLKYAWLFARAYGLPFFGPFIVIRALRQRSCDRLLVVTATAAYAAYVVAIGGDRFEFRFWIPILPLLAWAATDLAQAVVSRRLALALAAMLVVWTLHGSLQSERTQLGTGTGTGIASVTTIRLYAAVRSFNGRELRRLIDAGLLDKSLVLATAGAGAVPYYTDWPTVDVLGLNDSYVARLPVTSRGIIGHERRAPLRYLQQRNVVLFDALDRIVISPERVPLLPKVLPWGDERVPLRLVRVADTYLTFATFASEEAFRRAFVHFEVLR